MNRPRRVVFVGIAVFVLAGAALVFRGQIRDVYGYLFPDSIIDDALARTSDAAPTTDGGPPLPEVSRSGDTAGDRPALTLRSLVRLDGPSALVDPPGAGPVLVTTLVGQVHEVDLATGATDVVLDISALVSTGGERGLLGMALAPDADRLYLNFTNIDGDTEIVSLPFDGRRPQGTSDDLVRHLLIGQPYRNHNGGHLVFGPDGALWIGVGDGGSANDPVGMAQDVDVLLGKMLRVVPNPEGGVHAPTTNPEWGRRREVWAIGLRNPWRYSFDRETNRLWVADVGQNAIEEITVVDPSSKVNFGWDRLEGTRPFDGKAGPDLTDPVIEYTHDDGCSVTGGYVYRGTANASLRGWYFFGDYCGGWIRAVPADDPRVEPRQLASDLGPVVSFAELEDGELLMLGADEISALVSE